MSEGKVQVELAGKVARVTLNRPEVHNAFDAELIASLTKAYADLGTSNDVRAIVLAARGKSFSAGGDVAWMKQQGAASIQENTADALKLAEMFHAISFCPKPTIVAVQGAAMGGGVGLVAACDIAIGANSAVFAMSEVRLGLIPATIAPYVVRAIGERNARRLFQTAERFDAATAHRMGLLHEVVPAEELARKVEDSLQALLAGAPEAQTAAKELVFQVADRTMDADLRSETARLIAVQRATAEGREGLSAFLEKRAASWVQERS